MLVGEGVGLEKLGLELEQRVMAMLAVGWMGLGSLMAGMPLQ